MKHYVMARLIFFLIDANLRGEMQITFAGQIWVLAFMNPDVAEQIKAKFPKDIVEEKSYA